VKRQVNLNTHIIFESLLTPFAPNYQNQSTLVEATACQSWLASFTQYRPATWPTTCLSLPERNGAELLAELHLLGELVESGGRVCADGQDEDEWSGRRGILEDETQIRRLRLDEPLSEVLRHEVLHRVRHLVRPQAAQHEDLLEHVQLRVPAAWKFRPETSSNHADH